MPIKHVSKGDAVFTLSHKGLVMPLLSRAHIRKNLLNAGAQLCQDVSWTNYEAYNMDSKELLTFLYSESSWRYKILRDSNVSHDKHLLEPQQDEVVASRWGWLFRLTSAAGSKLGHCSTRKETSRLYTLATSGCCLV